MKTLMILCSLVALLFAYVPAQGFNLDNDVGIEQVHFEAPQLIVDEVVIVPVVDFEYGSIDYGPFAPVAVQPVNAFSFDFRWSDTHYIALEASDVGTTYKRLYSNLEDHTFRLCGYVGWR